MICLAHCTALNTVPLPATFLPLCGNGKLDTIESYNTINISKSTFVAQIDTKATNVTLFATETCDDGNRNDFDGCSADCMHRDLWVSACKLQLDTDLVDPEAIAYVPQRGMLLSTATNLYLIASIPSVNDVQVKLQNLGSKKTVLANFFVTKQGTLAWSAKDKAVYLVNFKGTSATLDPFFTVSLQKDSNDTAFLFPDKNLALFHDSFYIALYNLSSKQKLGECTSQLNLFNAMYMADLQKDLVYLRTLQAANTSSQVIVKLQYDADQTVSGITCDNDIKFLMANNIWVDAFTPVANTAFTTSTQYDMTVAGPTPTPGFTTFYSPLGVWAEVPSNSPRNWLDPSIDQTKLLSMYVGNLNLYNAAMNKAKIDCWDNKDKKCIYNLLSQSYDLLAAYSPSETWLDKLKLTAFSNVPFPEIYSQPAVYNEILNKWTTEITKSAYTKRIKDVAINQVTGNAWLLRSDGIFEISKSGVILRLGNSDKCMPSGVALCKTCAWAEVGSPCKSCLNSIDTSSWAWSMQCPDCVGNSLIKFTYNGPAPIAALQGVNCNPSSSPMTYNTVNADSYEVTINSLDPPTCMRSLMPALAAPNVDVTVRPYLTIIVPGTQSDSIMPLDKFIGIVLGSVFGCCFCVCAALCIKKSTTGSPITPNHNYKLLTREIQYRHVPYTTTPLQTCYVQASPCYTHHI